MLLTKDYKNIQLTDFSTSRVIDENMTSKYTLFSIKHIQTFSVGVDPFRAPEVIDEAPTREFENNGGYKLDVWSFGLSFYTCCNEERMFVYSKSDKTATL